MTKTGWYGIPGTAKSTKTHVVAVVARELTPICSYRPAVGYEFQICATGHELRYVECKECRDKIRAALAEEGE